MVRWSGDGRGDGWMDGWMDGDGTRWAGGVGVAMPWRAEMRSQVSSVCSVWESPGGAADESGQRAPVDSSFNVGSCPGGSWLAGARVCLGVGWLQVGSAYFCEVHTSSLSVHLQFYTVVTGIQHFEVQM